MYICVLIDQKLEYEKEDCTWTATVSITGWTMRGVRPISLLHSCHILPFQPIL